MSTDIQALLRQIVSSSAFIQLFPFIVLFLVPVTVIYVAPRIPSPTNLLYSLVNMLESLGISWLWSSSTSGNTSGSGARHHHEKKAKKSRTRASKAEKIAIGDSSESGSGYDGYFPGLVNVSGTYCFMNSTIQVCCSPCLPMAPYLILSRHLLLSPTSSRKLTLSMRKQKR